MSRRSVAGKANAARRKADHNRLRRAAYRWMFDNDLDALLAVESDVPRHQLLSAAVSSMRELHPVEFEALVVSCRTEMVNLPLGRPPGT